MNFEDHFEKHFLKHDIPAAKLNFNIMTANLNLFNSYKKKGDKANSIRTYNNMMNALSDINELTLRKEESNQMHLHHLLNYPQKWYPV